MSYSTVTFYIAAHYEDCAAFCGQQIDAQIANPKTKVVFIDVTASDEVDPDRWWEAREQQGSPVAAGIVLPSQAMTTHIAQIQGHPMVVYESGNCVTYCLRLPRGNFDECGTRTPGDSLTKLRTLKPLRTVDGSTVYTSWLDFCATIAGILAYERRGICDLHPWINAPDYFSLYPAADHADHKAVAEAVRSFARREYYNRAWWLTACPPTLPSDGLVRRRNQFLPYNGDIKRVTTFSQPDDLYADDSKSIQHFARDEKQSRRLVPWYQFDLDTPPESRPCP